jgi:hypothetical protein
MKSFVGLCALLLWLGLGCSSGDDGPGAGGMDSGDDGGSAGQAASGGGGQSGASSGGGGGSGSGATSGGGGAGASSGGGGSAATSGGTNASGGSGGTGAGGSGGDALADQDACTEATHHIPSFFFRYDEALILTNCGVEPTNHRALESGVSNVDSTRGADELILVAPILAGTQAAISVATETTPTDGTIELWGGAGEMCGPMTELLWWNHVEDRRVCATFTPSQDVTRLSLLIRQQTPLRARFSGGMRDVSICPTGSCPGEQAGFGLAPGVTLQAPDQLYATLSPHLGFYYALGGYEEGLFVLRYEDGQSQLTEEPRLLKQGALRTGPFDRYGDAVYCAGEGSTLTDYREDREIAVRLQNLTRLACEGGGSGTATVSIAHTSSGDRGTAQVTTSLPGYAASDVPLAGECRKDRCHFHFVFDGGMTIQQGTHLQLVADGDLGTYLSPTGMARNILSATWVHMPLDGDVEAACASGGQIDYDPEGTTTITLSGLDDPSSCPGEPVTPSETEIWLD